MSLSASQPVPRRTWITVCACFLAALMIRPVQDRIQRHLEERGPDADVLYLASPAVIKKMALGYESLLADVYWMRAIQYYGRREEAARRPVRYKNLAAMLDITSTLDPEMLDVYHAGSWFLAEPEPIGAGKPEEAVELLNKGISYHPLAWRLRLDKGFVYFWFFKDYRKAGEAWLSGSRMTTAPVWMAGLAAAALARGGEMETAKMLWQQQLEQSDRAEVRENARNHVQSLQVMETIWTLEFFLEKYRDTHGKRPGRLEDLVNAGYLRYVPTDPSGVPYAYEPSGGDVSLSPDSRVRFLGVPPEYRDTVRQKLARLYNRR